MIRSFRLILSALLGVIAGYAQVQVHFGVDAGVPITDTLPSSSTSTVSGADYSLNRFNSVTKRLLIGPSLRLDLPKGLGLELDAIYQRVNYDSTILSSYPEIPSFYKSFEAMTANRWQFPLLVQYGRKLARAKIFVEAGPAISTIAGNRGTLTTTSTGITIAVGTAASTTESSESSSQVTYAGITTGAGVDVPLFHIHLRPEFRYSHWFSPNSTIGTEVVLGFASVLLGPVSVPSPQISQNEASFLLGLSF
ncbi:MAG TPA: outer membrane beta-barrel protein [Bryobacteraceae bacterium]|jgi:hypothetical protein|nr:outer membrane beta-barrel protein [Bryobacteraceae bacterium]